MHRITVKIACRGAPLSDGNYSKTGQMWLETPEGSHGFGPEIEGDPFGPGELIENDTDHYKEVILERDFQLNDRQYNNLQAYLADPVWKD
jgi:hypothetical protein